MRITLTGRRATGVALLLAIVAGVPGAPPAAAAGPACGAVLVPARDWLDGSGVDVRANGAFHAGATACAGWSTANPAVQNGYGWQGVELAARLYAVKGWGLVQANGGPGTEPYRHGARYLPEGSTSLHFHANGTGYLPVPGDLVVETNGTSGRVAVVDRVDATTVHVVEQNTAAGGRHAYPRSGSRLSRARGAGASVRGILHSPRNRTAVSTTRVNVAPNGTQAYRASDSPAVSPDGRYVAFTSHAANLVPGDTNDANDAFVRDLRTGTTSRISVATGGGQADGPSATAAISAGGRYVAFTSKATNLVPDDTNRRWDVFVHDRATGSTTRVNVRADGRQVLDADAHSPSISADGRHVVFGSHSADLVAYPPVGHPIDQVYLRDRAARTTTIVSRATGGAAGNSHSYRGVISPDGRYVAFASTATNFGQGYGGRLQVFVRDRTAGTTALVSVGSPGGKGNGDSTVSAISATGRYVAFVSTATNLVAGDTNHVHDIFVRDRQTRVTTRASVATGGAQANGWSYQATVSADGRYVAFTSTATNLVRGDTDHTDDVFRHDRRTGATTLVSVAADGGPADRGSTFGMISPDGRRIAFASWAGNLVPGDTNGLGDVFVRTLG